RVHRQLVARGARRTTRPAADRRVGVAPEIHQLAVAHVEQDAAAHRAVGADGGDDFGALDLPRERHGGPANALRLETERDQAAERSAGGGETGAPEKLAP